MNAKGDKVPRPDGFPFRFAQSFWDLFREDIIGLFQVFHNLANFDHKFLKSFIILFLKIGTPVP